MALEMNDILALKGMGKEDGGMSPYEQFRMADKQSRRPSGVGVAGLVLGTVGTVAAVGAWIFGGTYASSKSAQAKDAAKAASDLAMANHNSMLNLLNQQQANQSAMVDKLITALQRETDARTEGDKTITMTINDSLSGSQQGSQNTTQSTVQSVSQDLLTKAMLGNLSENPQKVTLYAAPQPCGCPGCNCNG